MIETPSRLSRDPTEREIGASNRVTRMTAESTVSVLRVVPPMVRSVAILQMTFSRDVNRFVALCQSPVGSFFLRLKGFYLGATRNHRVVHRANGSIGGKGAVFYKCGRHSSDLQIFRSGVYTLSRRELCSRYSVRPSSTGRQCWRCRSGRRCRVNEGAQVVDLVAMSASGAPRLH